MNSEPANPFSPRFAPRFAPDPAEPCRRAPAVREARRRTGPACRILAGLLITGSVSPAFPPAPYYTLHGIVRDQTGQTVTADRAAVLLLKDNKELSRTPVSAALGADLNYELPIRLDQTRPGTALYSAAAIAAQGVFSLAVEMGGQRYYPIEVSGNLTAGKGGERVKLDLTLGEDTDGDGLPDAWEMWQLFMAGHFQGPNGWELHLIDRAGDFDGDGQSNFLEYVAGTFAGDAMQRFDISIKEKSGDKVRLEFYGITGKVYTIERSADNQTWTRIPLATGNAAAAPDTSFRASEIGVVFAFVTPAPDAAKEFYRLTVR